MTPRRETQTPVLDRAVLERVPEPHRRGRIRVEKGAILVRGHAAADLGLFADDHGLEDAGIAKAEGFCDCGVCGGEGDGAVRGVEPVQVVAYFVDGFLFGLGQVAGRGEGVFFEEEPDVVA